MGVFFLAAEKTEIAAAFTFRRFKNTFGNKKIDNSLTHKIISIFKLLF